MTDLSWPLQRKLLRAKGIGFNAEVYKHFKDVTDDDTTNIVSRRKLRDSLLIGTKDSRTTASFKIEYFDRFVLGVQYKPNVYGIPVDEYHETITFKPQIELFFAQDGSSVAEGKTAIKARINFRLMNETLTSLTKTEVLSLATKIKNEFVGSGEGYVFAKGKYIVSYVDKENGYHLQIYTTSKDNGIEVIKKVLSIRNHTYDADKVGFHSPEKDSINNPTGTITVLGKQVTKNRWRPTANVQFRYAVLKLSGLNDDQILVDTTGHFRDALIKV